MILDDIKKANVEAMKAHNADARTICSVVMNKAMVEGINLRAQGKELEDVNMVQIIQKTIKELVEEAENYSKVNNIEEVNKINSQKDFIAKFLPQMMSAEEIHNIIASMEDKSVPTVMKKFKAEYAGKCDMRTVQEELKKF